MALRSFDSVPYIPFLGLRPAEIQALEELPSSAKSRMMPLVQLGPWTTAHHLQSSIDRWEAAYGVLPCFVCLSDVDFSTTPRPVHNQLMQLKDPANGYDGWCRFVESIENFVPTLQLSDLTQYMRQATRLYELNRGIMVLIERDGLRGLANISEAVSRVTRGGLDVCFMLDLGRGTRDLLMMTLQITQYLWEVWDYCPDAFVSISASSFPDVFTSITNQDIFERILFNSVRDQVGGKFIYSDRGSARAERQLGGGGTPAPRVDYATSSQWAFYRSDDEMDRNEAYFQQARLAMASAAWDGSLRIWGTQMIERTALGDPSAIVSPKRSTAARINIHLHRQTFYGEGQGLYETDDIWVD